MFLSNQVETLYICSLYQLDNKYTTNFDFRTYSREIIYMFPDLAET